MKLFGEKFPIRRGYISLFTLLLSLFFFVEAIAAAGDIFLPVVYYDIKPTVTPTSTPTLIPGGVVVINNHTSYTTTPGRLHVVGEVQNNTSYTLQNVKVTAKFYNSSNQLLDTRSAFTFMNDLPAGNKTCFNISLDAPSGWKTYQFEPVTYLTNGEPLPNLTAYNISASYSSQYKYYRIAGSVRNNENVTVYDVRPVGTVYNITNRVIGCEFTLVSGYSLNPGASSSFEILFLDRDYIDATTYRLQVDGNIP